MHWYEDTYEFSKSGVFTLEVFNGEKNPDKDRSEKRVSANEGICIVEYKSND